MITLFLCIILFLDAITEISSWCYILHYTFDIGKRLPTLLT